MMLFPGHKEDPGNALDAAQGTTVSCPPSNVPPVSVPNQCPPSMDWHKLQHQFLDGKNKVYAVFFFFFHTKFNLIPLDHERITSSYVIDSNLINFLSHIVHFLCFFIYLTD